MLWLTLLLLSLAPRSTSTTPALSDLLEMRQRLARQLSKPLNAIYPRAVLETIATKLPTTDRELRELRGVGPQNIKYAPEVLSITRRYSSTARPTGPPAPIVEPDSIKGQQQLSAEQQRVLRRVVAGGNTFITGSAGTGKSFLLREIIEELKKKHGDKAIGITGSTGIAALNIKGQTIHSYAGIGLGVGLREDIFLKLSKNSKALARWRRTKVLIIDEISMLDIGVFEMLDDFTRRIRKSSQPFGGIQLVLVGDFLQLPPVGSKEFCFESRSWAEAGLREPSALFNLKEVWRQRDSKFVSILGAVRMGRVTPELLSELNRCWVGTKPAPEDGIAPTKLYCVNVDVDRENLARLKELKSPEMLVEARDSVVESPSSVIEAEALMQLADKTISGSICLKVGAQVMLVRNSADSWKERKGGLVNGQRGVILRIQSETDATGAVTKVPVVRFDNGVTTAVNRVDWEIRSPNGKGFLLRQQVPLKLAWAVTVHKCQGTTLSRAELMVANSFDFGQAYTALSRVTGIDGLWLTHPLDRSSIRTSPKVISYYESILTK